MAKINWGRVVLGGMLAGIVLIALSAVFTALFAGRREISTAMRTLRPSTSGSAAPLFFLSVFLFLGMLMIWWYAALRPLFGPGPKTAAIAGLSVWLTAVWLGLVGFVCKSLAMGEPYSLPSGPMWPVLYLVIAVASTIAGASLYKEQRS